MAPQAPSRSLSLSDFHPCYPSFQPPSRARTPSPPQSASLAAAAAAALMRRAAPPTISRSQSGNLPVLLPPRMPVDMKDGRVQAYWPVGPKGTEPIKAAELKDGKQHANWPVGQQSQTICTPSQQHASPKNPFSPAQLASSNPFPRVPLSPSQMGNGTSSPQGPYAPSHLVSSASPPRSPQGLSQPGNGRSSPQAPCAPSHLSSASPFRSSQTGNGRSSPQAPHAPSYLANGSSSPRSLRVPSPMSRGSSSPQGPSAPSHLAEGQRPSQKPPSPTSKPEDRALRQPSSPSSTQQELLRLFASQPVPNKAKKVRFGKVETIAVESFKDATGAGSGKTSGRVFSCDGCDQFFDRGVDIFRVDRAVWLCRCCREAAKKQALYAKHSMTSPAPLKCRTAESENVENSLPCVQKAYVSDPKTVLRQHNGFASDKTGSHLVTALTETVNQFAQDITTLFSVSTANSVFCSAQRGGQLVESSLRL